MQHYLTMVNIWKQPLALQMDEHIKNVVYIHTIYYYLVLKINPAIYHIMKKPEGHYAK